MKPFEDIHHVHCLGLGGVGVSALARFFASRGARVSGCDDGAAPEIQSVIFMGGHDAAHVTRDIDLVVFSPAVPHDHSELIRAKALGIITMDYPEALGLIAGEFSSIAVSGTHGKSTTTALLAAIFIEADLDPTVIVGAQVPGFERNFHAGLGKHFIVEGCEYRRGMLKIRPDSAIITNIEADHLDYYKDLSDIHAAFREYALALPPTGFLVYPGDDKDMNAVIRGAVARAITFGFSELTTHIRGTDFSETEKGVSFMVEKHGVPMGKIVSPLPGLYNAENILAAIAMADAHGISFGAVSLAVENFRGIGRRFEFLGTRGKTDVILDYAHHPSALRAAADALRARYKGKRVLTVFQPHQTDRTRKLADEFAAVFSAIPDLVVSEIYQVKGREDADPFSVETIVRKANEGRKESPILFARDIEELASVVAPLTGDFDAVLFLGAGDIDKVARSLVASE